MLQGHCREGVGLMCSEKAGEGLPLGLKGTRAQGPSGWQLRERREGPELEREVGARGHEGIRMAP